MQQTTLLAGIIPSAKKLSTWSWTVFENWQTTVPDTMACFFRVFFVFVFNHNLRKQMVLLFSLFSLTICWRVGSEDCKDSASTMHAGVALDPVWVV